MPPPAAGLRPTRCCLMSSTAWSRAATVSNPNTKFPVGTSSRMKGLPGACCVSAGKKGARRRLPSADRFLRLGAAAARMPCLILIPGTGSRTCRAALLPRMPASPFIPQGRTKAAGLTGHGGQVHMGGGRLRSIVGLPRQSRRVYATRPSRGAGAGPAPGGAGEQAGIGGHAGGVGPRPSPDRRVTSRHAPAPPAP